MSESAFQSDLSQALNNSDIPKVLSMLKTLHSRAGTLKLSLYPTKILSFAPEPVLAPSNPHPPPPAPVQAAANFVVQNSNPEIYNQLVFFGFSEAASRRASCLTSSIAAAVDYITQNNLA